MLLTQNQARVIGCLLEKERTTPDQYPLSLNSLTLACNQKSSREPVLSLTEADVQQTIDELLKARLVTEQTGFGSRVIKYQHRFCNTEFSDLNLSSEHIAIICVMLLRGPQSPGELKTRTQRLHPFSDVAEVELNLQQLMQREIPGFVAQHNKDEQDSDLRYIVHQLPKESGKRDLRYHECFSDIEVRVAASNHAAIVAPLQSAQDAEQIKALQAKNTELEAEVIRLNAIITALQS